MPACYNRWCRPQIPQRVMYSSDFFSGSMKLRKKGSLRQTYFFKFPEVKHRENSKKKTGNNECKHDSVLVKNFKILKGWTTPCACDPRLQEWFDLSSRSQPLTPEDKQCWFWRERRKEHGSVTSRPFFKETMADRPTYQPEHVGQREFT